jgi:hypothetical protein
MGVQSTASTLSCSRHESVPHLRGSEASEHRGQARLLAKSLSLRRPTVFPELDMSLKIELFPMLKVSFDQYLEANFGDECEWNNELLPDVMESFGTVKQQDFTGHRKHITSD